MKNSKKTIGPVVAVSMLIVVAVVALVGFQSWYENYQTSVLAGVEVKSKNLGNELEINSLINSQLYIINNYQDNFTISRIEANKIDCSISNVNLNLGINNLSLSACLSQLTSDTVKIVLYSNTKVLEKEFYIGGNSLSLIPSITCISNPPEGFHGGNGSLLDPFQICNCTQLQNISNYLSANYTLVQNIDCSDTINWDSGSGFAPLSVFTGSFDGASYTISDLFINRPTTNDVGIFGRVNNTNSIITSTGIVNANISGKSSVGAFIALIINGSLNNSYSSGYVSGNWTVGGLVGASGYIGTGGRINNSFSTSNVYSIGTNSGGLVGFTVSSYVANSYASGNVNGTNKVGGLIGYTSYGYLENSYANANVNGVDRIGGLIGEISYVDINNSYASGNVNGTFYVGGLVGDNYKGNLDNVYWNNHTENPSIGISKDNNAQTTTAIQNNVSYFYYQTSPPMNLWNTNLWSWSGSAFPTLS